jgi:uncharacterized protein YaiI (UPF0178 family)
MDQLRSSGAITGGPSALSKANLQAFANELDKLVSRHVRAQASEP